MPELAVEQADSGEYARSGLIAQAGEFPRLWPAPGPTTYQGASGDFRAAACPVAARLLRPQVAESRAALAEVGVKEDW